jgi:hypothetical protein
MRSSGEEYRDRSGMWWRSIDDGIALEWAGALQHTLKIWRGVIDISSQLVSLVWLCCRRIDALAMPHSSHP